jgi:hypothetical protein
MRRRHFGSVCVAILFTVFTSLYIAVPKAFSQQAVRQDECNQWVKSHADQSMQMKMEPDGERSMLMLTPSGDPLPVVCLVRDDPFKPPRYEGIGTATRTVPGGAEVQAYFNQGLQFYYGFNNRESYRALRYAACVASKGTPPCVESKGTPACAMCYVVQALALGPDINRTSENEPDRKAAKQALAAAVTAVQTDFDSGGITEKERAKITVLIDALKMRFADCPASLPPNCDCQSEKSECKKCQDWRNYNYQQAISAQFDKYQDDPDYVILFADAVMNQIPWGYWNSDGSPKCAAVKQSQAAIEAALERSPLHNGLIHWYIHLMEMSGKPDLAEPYARKLAGLAPNAGHLVHMPSHIYYRLGDMKSSIATNHAAVATDKNYFAHDDVHHPRPDGDRYRFGYYPHNIHFELASAVLIGQRKTVEDATKTLLESAPVDPTGYRADRYRAVYYLTRLNFASSDQIKQFPRPKRRQFFASVAYYYAQLVADIVPFNTGAAEKDYQQLELYAQKYRNNAKGEDNPECDPAKKVPGDISLCVIRIISRLARARISAGNFQDPEDILNLTDDAAKTQRALPYDEPPAWLYPVDQTFAGLMLSRYVSKRPQRRSYLELAMKRLEDSLQEKQPLPSGVFPKNAWAYFGLWQIAEKLGLQDKAQKYKAKYDELWQGGSRPEYLQM